MLRVIRLEGPVREPAEVVELAEEGPARGEIVLLIGPPLKGQVKQSAETGHSISKEVERLIAAEGLDRKSALKRIARERGISKREAYRLMIAEPEE